MIELTKNDDVWFVKTDIGNYYFIEYHEDENLYKVFLDEDEDEHLDSHPVMFSNEDFKTCLEWCVRN